MSQLTGEGILESAAGSIVALPRRFVKGYHGRKKEDKIQRFPLKDLSDAHTDVDLGRKRVPESLLSHIGQALIRQDNGGVHHPVNLCILLLNLFIGLPHCLFAGCIRRDVFGRRPHGSQSIHFGLDDRILLTPADPYDPGLAGADHVFAPYFSDTAGTADDHIDATGPVQGLGRLKRMQQNQLLPVPLPLPVCPTVAHGIRWKGENFVHRPVTAGFKVQQADLPFWIFFGHGAGQPVHRCMSRIHRIFFIDGLALNGDDAPAQNSRAIA